MKAKFFMTKLYAMLLTKNRVDIFDSSAVAHFEKFITTTVAALENSPDIRQGMLIDIDYSKAETPWSAFFSRILVYPSLKAILVSDDSEIMSGRHGIGVIGFKDSVNGYRLMTHFPVDASSAGPLEAINKFIKMIEDFPILSNTHPFLMKELNNHLLEFKSGGQCVGKDINCGWWGLGPKDPTELSPALDPIDPLRLGRDGERLYGIRVNPAHHVGYLPINLFDLSEPAFSHGGSTVLSLDAIKQLSSEAEGWAVQEPPREPECRTWWAIGVVYQQVVARYGIIQGSFYRAAEHYLMDALVTSKDEDLLEYNFSKNYAWAVPVSVLQWYDELMKEYSVWAINDPHVRTVGALTFGLHLTGELSKEVLTITDDVIHAANAAVTQFGSPGFRAAGPGEFFKMRAIPGGQYILMHSDLIAKVTNALLPLLETNDLSLAEFLFESIRNHSQVLKKAKLATDASAQQDDKVETEEELTQIQNQLRSKLSEDDLQAIRETVMIVHKKLGSAAAMKHLQHYTQMFCADL